MISFILNDLRKVIKDFDKNCEKLSVYQLNEKLNLFTVGKEIVSMNAAHTEMALELDHVISKCEEIISRKQKEV